MDNPLSDAGEELYELGQDTGKKFVRDVVKGVAKSVKQQIIGKAFDNSSNKLGSENKQNKPKAGDSSKSPVTGKPVPSKKMMTQLSDAVAKLQMVKLQKIREELEKQRLKVSSPTKAVAGESSVGPEVPASPAKPKEDIVSKTLKSSQSTGEIKGGGYG